MCRRNARPAFCAVIDAARARRPTGGRPMPGNVTEDGRKLGLLAAHAAPRCQATRRNGQPCGAAALRGARRCSAHGGRVDVPGHRHNLRRWLNGDIERSMSRRDEVVEGRALWSAMSFRERQAFVGSLPAKVVRDEDLTSRALSILRRNMPITVQDRRRRRSWLLERVDV